MARSIYRNWPTADDEYKKYSMIGVVDYDDERRWRKDRSFKTLCKHFKWAHNADLGLTGRRPKEDDRNFAEIEDDRLWDRQDPDIKSRNALRARVRTALKKYRISDKELFGCSQSQLRRHISIQFVKGMSWDNYGGVWHIDHIIPVSAYNLRNPDEVKKLCNYSNLRPMWAEDNLSKGPRFTKELVEQYGISDLMPGGTDA